LAPNRRRVLQTGAVGLATSAGCIAGEFPPSGVGTGSGTFGNGSTPSNPTNAKEDLQWWAAQPADGEEGRPFPVTGSWNIGRFYNQPWDEETAEAWSPTYFTEEIENERHVLPTFKDFINPGTRNVRQWEEVDVEKLVDEQYYPQALSYCAEHNLPIAFRGWNYGTYVASYEKQVERHTNRTFSVEETGALVVEGERKLGKSDPFGPVERWRELGRVWFGSPVVEELASRYPEPPRIVMLDNAEVHVRRLNANMDRFVAKFGKETVENMSKERKAEELEKAYAKRYAAMFEAARKAAPDAWSKVLQFVAYNNFPWPKPGNNGANGVRRIEDVEQLTEAHQGWKKHDGGMPEVYLNDWQVGRGKRDYHLWSPQEESTTHPIFAEQVFEERPQYYFANIGWEGGLPARGRSATNILIVSGPASDRTRRWDLDRYEGMLQFALWANRSRSFREFRGGSTRDAYYQATWERYMDMVDRVWETEALHEFWKHGDLVSNPEVVEAINTAYEESPNHNATYERFYLLTCDANPAPTEVGRFRKGLNLSVYALALQLGEAPERRWLVVAQTPENGGRSEVTVTIPDYGDVTLDAVSRSGSFYVVTEGEETVERVVTGHPAAIDVSPASSYVDVGGKVDVTASVTVPPEDGFEGFEWVFSDGETKSTRELGTETVLIGEADEHRIRVRGMTGSGDTVVGETTVWTRDEPDEAVVCDVSMATASSWSGPWETVGDEWPGELLEYRMLPNAGVERQPILVGGEFVDDDERGPVLELAGSDEGVADGVWVPTSRLTAGSAEGRPNRTITFHVQPNEVEGRQVLYCEGHANAGWNLYLDGDTLYGGGWGVKDKFGNWKNWISGGSVTAGEWHEVALVLDGATSDGMTDGALSLYLNGNRVASGAARRLPHHHRGPRLGSVNLNTHFHDGRRYDGDTSFSGRFSKFVQLNVARMPQ
jgi:hypothetical protein